MAGPWIMGIVLLGLGGFVCYHSIELSLGKPSRPGPGFFPLGLGVILMLLAVFYLVQSGRREAQKSSAPSGHIHRTVVAVAILCCYAAVVDWLGYLITTFLFFGLWLVLIERKQWYWVLFLAPLAVGGVYIFNWLFSVQLPKGLIRGL